MYHKKLKNMSSKINISKNTIISNIKNIKKKRLDQTTKITSKFKNKYNIKIIIHTHSYIIIQNLNYISIYTNIIFKLYTPYSIQTKHNKSIPI